MASWLTRSPLRHTRRIVHRLPADEAQDRGERQSKNASPANTVTKLEVPGEATPGKIGQHGKHNRSLRALRSLVPIEHPGAAGRCVGRPARSAGYLTILLRIPFQEVVRRVSAELAELGFDDLRPAHTAVFQHLSSEGSRLTSLAERAQISKQATDRRAALVFPTDRGWEQIRTALSIIAEIEAEWTRRLGGKGMQQLRELLSELGAATQQ